MTIETGLSANQWAEYDSAAKWCAQRGLKGKEGDKLPANMDSDVYLEICQHNEAFQERVRLTAYALAMEKSSGQDSAA